MNGKEGEEVRSRAPDSLPLSILDEKWDWRDRGKKTAADARGGHAPTAVSKAAAGSPMYDWKSG